MRADVFVPSNAPDHREVLAAFAGGLQEHGVEVYASLLEEYPGTAEADFAVVFGVGKLAVPYSRYREAVRQTYHRAGKRVVVLERGYIKRTQYHAAGWDGLNNRADFLNCDKPPDRFGALCAPLRPYRTPADGNVLLIGQVPWDASVQLLDHGGWLQRTVAVLQRYTDRPIHYRPHPLAGDAIPDVPGTVRSTGGLDDAIEASWAVVTHNSNVGVDAALAGRVVFAGDTGSMAYPVANLNLARIETPLFAERHPWANGIAYAQWSLEEMAGGMAWEHLRHGLSMPARGLRETAGAPGGAQSVGSAPFTWSNCGENNRTH